MELKLELFRDAIESRLVNLARFGPWPLGAEVAAVSQPNPWQRAEAAAKPQQFCNRWQGFGVREKLVDPGHLELKQLRNPWQPKLAQVGPQPMSHTYGDPRLGQG